MPKVGPNKVRIDPKAYAARVTRAKKTVANADPAVKQKLKEYYPEITKEEVAKQAIKQAPSVDEKVLRSMPITEPQLKQIKKHLGIE